MAVVIAAILAGLLWRRQRNLKVGFDEEIVDSPGISPEALKLLYSDLSDWSVSKGPASAIYEAI